MSGKYETCTFIHVTQSEAGVKAAELARKYGISSATLYNWKARYGGMDASQVRRLKELNRSMMPFCIGLPG